jgi:hypothetical protein
VVQVDDGSRAADGAGRRREQGGGSWAPTGARRRELGADGSRRAELLLEGAGRPTGGVAGGTRQAGPGRRDQAGGSRRAEVRRWDSASSEEASSTGRRQTSGAGELRARRDAVAVHGQIERGSHFPGWRRAQTRS